PKPSAPVPDNPLRMRQAKSASEPLPDGGSGTYRIRNELSGGNVGRRDDKSCSTPPALPWRTRKNRSSRCQDDRRGRTIVNPETTGADADDGQSKQLRVLRERVRRIGKKSSSDVFELGAALEEAAGLLRGRFGLWVEHECG